MKKPNAVSSQNSPLILFLFLTFFTPAPHAFAEPAGKLPSEAMTFADATPKNAPAQSIIALNRDLQLEDQVVPKGTELIVGENGELLQVGAGEDRESIRELGLNIKDLNANQYTELEQDDATGEIKPYLLPGEDSFAGPGRRRHKRGGVTNCYHVVKAIVRHRITLTGIPAYTAAPQLRRAGWRHYSDYGSAPMGSVCVFAAGGRATASGGQRYGHIGVKGAGGIANPTSGFALGRPFLGCWNED